MNYIILDLEWNQGGGKASKDGLPPFEIIEIGAVKMSEEFELLGEFSELIRPVLYRELHVMTKKVTKINPRELRHARGFEAVIQDFFAWCGEDYILCTWGGTDLTELQRNIEFYGLENPLRRPLFYYDIQKLYGLYFEAEKTQHSLEYAVDSLGLQKKIPFHRASADTYYTALVMTAIDMDKMKAYYSIDYHVIPTAQEELNLTFPGYSKYVSHGFADKDEVMSNPKVISMECNVCRRRVRKKIRWFASGRNYLCVGFCSEHGYLKGKIRLRKSDNGSYYAVKTIKQITREEAEEIRQRKEELRLRRAQKHHMVGALVQTKQN